MKHYKKQDVKDSLTLDDVCGILEELGAEPRVSGDIIYCRTICHEGDSHKLIYFNNTGYFYCHTNCGCIGDIFALVGLVLQTDCFDACVNWVAKRVSGGVRLTGQGHKPFILETEEIEELPLDFSEPVTLPEYDNPIIHYPKPRILDWEREGITKDVCDDAGICYEPTIGAILIPHRDMQGRLIGIKQRTLVLEDELACGKYRPYSSHGICYTFPTALNLYGIDKAKKSIATRGIAVIVEAEKSVLEARSMANKYDVPFVACSGSNISKFQMKQLLDCGATSVVFALDKDYQKEEEPQYKQLIDKYKKLASKYSDYFECSFIVDRKGLLTPHQSPTDAGKDIWNTLYRDRLTAQQIAELP